MNEAISSPQGEALVTPPLPSRPERPPCGIPVSVRNLVKNYGATRAIDGVSFDIRPGTILALLGPSGCGKTTTLRCIAGLEEPDEGEILIGERPVTSVPRGIMLPPDRRELGMVFQSYAIWPHMTAGQNVAYPLKARRVGAGEIARRVAETLELVGLGGLADRSASKLSGGQQQRVALARAIIARPRVLLFDEPLSNLDAKLRARMRFELLRLQREVGITSLFVTHDQSEAMAIADELIVMNNGRIEQWGDARMIYSRPATAFVAAFIGTTNFLRGELIELPDATGLARIRLIDDAAVTLRGRLVGESALGARYLCVMRAEDLHPAEPGCPDSNCLEVRVEAAQYLGSAFDVRALMNGVEIRFSMEPHNSVGAGQPLQLQIAPAYCVLLRDT